MALYRGGSTRAKGKSTEGSVEHDIKECDCESYRWQGEGKAGEERTHLTWACLALCPFGWTPVLSFVPFPMGSRFLSFTVTTESREHIFMCAKKWCGMVWDAGGGARKREFWSQGHFLWAFYDLDRLITFIGFDFLIWKMRSSNHLYNSYPNVNSVLWSLSLCFLGASVVIELWSLVYSSVSPTRWWVACGQELS